MKSGEREGSHSIAMHVYKIGTREAGNNHGGERNNERSQQPITVSNCTQVCANNPGKSCAKIVLVNIRNRNSDHLLMKGYAIIDDQSNHTLARAQHFDYFKVNSAPERYSLQSCGGKTTLSGRSYSGFVVESLDGLESIDLPVVT